MRQSYTDIKTSFLQNSGNATSTDTTLLDFFKRQLVSRYQQAFAEISNRQTLVTKTASTVVGQQFYHYPPGLVDIHSCTVTIGSIPYPIITDDSQLQWDLVNQILLSVSAIPRFIFPRRDDFGIWPIPQGVYTITITHNVRDRSLLVDDYTTGTVQVTQNSQTVIGTGTTFTNAMIGRWFTMNDTTMQGEGYWYRIAAVTDATHLTLETSYMQVSVSGAAYRIGETPELPEEVHLSLAHGVISDYYAGPRGDIEKATWWNNMYWTGDGNNSSRGEKNNTVIGGILGAKQRYAGRSDGAIVWKHGVGSAGWLERMWASKITG